MGGCVSNGLLDAAVAAANADAADAVDERLVDVLGDDDVTITPALVGVSPQATSDAY